MHVMLKQPGVAPRAKKDTLGTPLEPEALGACVVYLGGLNYFFTVDERSPIVSRIGTIVGYLHITVEPFIAPPRASGTRDSTHFKPYVPPQVDEKEDQLYDFVDRTIEYRVTLRTITGFKNMKHSRIFLQYGFFRDNSQKTPLIANGCEDLTINFESRHIVDVTDPFAKYIAGGNLMVEVFGQP